MLKFARNFKFKNPLLGCTAAVIVGLAAFMVFGGIASSLGVNLIVCAIIGAVFFVPYFALGAQVFQNSTAFRDLFNIRR